MRTLERYVQAEREHMAVGSHELHAPALQGLEQAHNAAARTKNIFRRKGAKGPNPLAVKKKKVRKQAQASTAPEGAGAAEQTKRRRARRRRGDGDAPIGGAAVDA